MMIYFDESGNTGQNLLDASQPIYVLSSHNFSEIETKEILNPLTALGVELHFKHLKKYTKYQRQLLEIFNNKHIDEKRIKYYYVDKKYALVGHIVDLLIESVLYSSDIDIYKKGLNMSYLNSIYHFGTKVWKLDLFNDFLNTFQLMIRESTVINTNNFYNSLNNLYKSVDFKERVILDPILSSKSIISGILTSINKYSIDLSASSFLGLITHWGKQLNNKIDVIHDDSKQIEFWQEYIDFFANTIIDFPQEVGYDYRKMIYPLPINSIKLEGSHNCIQIQLADLIASSLTYSIKKRHFENDLCDDFANKILDSKIANINAYPIWPSNAITPEQLGTLDDTGINHLDYKAKMAALFHKEFDAVMAKIVK